MVDKSTLQAHKDAAVDFLQLVVTGRIEEAYRKHIDMQGRHHNIYFPADFYTLQQAMLEDHKQHPKKKFQILRVLADGDFVVVHSHIVMNSGDPGISVVHIFRFSGERIVEMWDVAQAIPSDSPNQSGAF